MKIGIQGWFLNHPNTGIGQYCLNLLSALSDVDNKNEYTIVTAQPIKLKLGSNFKVVTLPISNKIPSSSLKKIWWEQIQVTKFFKTQKMDLVFYPYPANPWVSNKIPSIVTIHDTIPWDRREYAPTLTSRLKHKQSKKALKKASGIVCVSQTTKNDLLRHVPSLSKIPIEVIHNGVAPALSKPLIPKNRESILNRYQLAGKKYFLYVGGYDERKNIHSILQAFLKYVAPTEEVRMVFVGDKAHFSQLYASLDSLKEVTQNKKYESLPGQVMLTGFVTEEELNALYCGSTALINTSLQEGFNLPIVEAATLHVPVICSNIPIHKEVMGNYPAIFVTAIDIDEIGKTMGQFCKDQNFLKEIKSKCESINLSYKWLTNANNLLKFYELVFNDHSHR